MIIKKLNYWFFIYKLKAYGIEESGVNWIEYIKRTRSFSVHISETKSWVAYTPIGVPQGSVISRHFFLIYINIPTAEFKTQYTCFLMTGKFLHRTT